jgi:hypothetical protein
VLRIRENVHKTYIYIYIGGGREGGSETHEKCLLTHEKCLVVEVYC